MVPCTQYNSYTIKTIYNLNLPNLTLTIEENLYILMNKSTEFMLFVISGDPLNYIHTQWIQKELASLQTCYVYG